MKKIICSFAFILLAIVAFGQQKVALNRNGTTEIYGGSNPFNDAYLAASSGDTIYLPGGNLPFPATIDKKLVIIGAGHYPSVTVATNRTVLNGTLTIGENADNLHLEGIEITSTLSFNTNHKVDGVVIKRCRIGYIYYNGDASTPCLNNVIRECVINGNVYFNNAKSSLFSNNIIGGTVNTGLEIGISNNIFLYSGYGSQIFVDIDNSSISNNIILQSYGTNYVHTGCQLSTFSNNTFVLTPPVESNTFTNNYNDIAIAGLFVNQTGNAFDYTHDYHLVNPTTYLGNDGKQVGIYGGLFPYKESALPVNPNIISKTIAPQTNSNGELNFQMQVKAQNN
jgi:hypothetical protein